jgi:RNA polymerase sigma factor (sigma-70 family)
MVLMNKRQHYPDQEILQGILRQDRDVMLYLYRQHFPMVHRFVLSNSGSEGEAEDLFQDIMVLLFDKTTRGELILTSSFSSFFFVLMRNKWFNQLRRKRLQPRVNEKLMNTYIESEYDYLPDQQTLEQTEKERIFFAWFSTMGEECRKVLLLFIEGNSIREVTRLMGYNSEQHTKNRRYRCKVSLFNKIKNDPRFKELSNGTGINPDNAIPRW